MKKIFDFNDELDVLILEAEKEYNFQPELTEKLDNIKSDFDEMTLLEIVLWKTNRYPEYSSGLLDDINSLRKEFTINKAKALLRKLLQLKGFDLPMASTVLRFACPDELQIIDQRVYRFITSGTDQFKKPYNDDRKIEMYFDYIMTLKEICFKYKIPFKTSDRIIYQLDKRFNSDHRIKY